MKRRHPLFLIRSFYMTTPSVVFDLSSYQPDFQAAAASTLKTGIAVLDDLDLRAVCIKATQVDGGYGWSLEYAVEISQLYRIFLFLCLRYPDQKILPPREVDEFWHLHILDTRAYVRDCEQVFGQYLHHFPYAGLRGAQHPHEEALVEATLALVRKHFPEWV